VKKGRERLWGRLRATSDLPLSDPLTPDALNCRRAPGRLRVLVRQSFNRDSPEDDLKNVMSRLLGRLTAYRDRRRVRAQIRHQRANERAESPYREQQRRDTHGNVMGDGAGVGF